MKKKMEYKKAYFFTLMIFSISSLSFNIDRALAQTQLPDPIPTATPTDIPTPTPTDTPDPTPTPTPTPSSIVPCIAALPTPGAGCDTDELLYETLPGSCPAANNKVYMCVCIPNHTIAPWGPTGNVCCGYASLVIPGSTTPPDFLSSCSSEIN